MSSSSAEQLLNSGRRSTSSPVDAVERALEGKKDGMSQTVNYFLWFLISAVVAYIALFLIKPDFVKKKVNGVYTNDVDWVKNLIASVVLGLIVVLIVWLINSCGK